MNKKISIILPARNEASSLDNLLPQILRIDNIDEVIVVNDASTDNTIEICKKYQIKVVNHVYQKGNGAAIKNGAREASGDILVFMDADGQHQANDIPKLLAKIDAGFDMVVGARSAASQASFGRLCANSFYNWFATLIVGQKIVDLTSGFRAVKVSLFKQFLYLLPNGFSYPSTITMAFFCSGYSVDYLPIVAKQRLGKSHIKPLQDGLRFLLILFKISTLYSPLKLFLPISALSFVIGCCNYAYTYATMNKFTNMSALLFTTSIIIFLMGLIAEQITILIYSHTQQK